MQGGSGGHASPQEIFSNLEALKCHFLCSITNKLMVEEREFFFRDIYKINTLLQVLNLDNMFYYILSMKDKNTIKRSSDYCLKILEIYDLESTNLS